PTLPDPLPGAAIPDSLLSGENATFLDEQYVRWLDDPRSVDPSIRALFERLEAAPANTGPRPGTAPAPVVRSIFAGGASDAESGVSPAEARRQARVVQLINASRVRGHLDAALDPPTPS
ncbi:MAG: 2-oxoglutarate dehydrogenase E1 component, partial [Myxococcota bacterium]